MRTGASSCHFCESFWNEWGRLPTRLEDQEEVFQTLRTWIPQARWKAKGAYLGSTRWHTSFPQLRMVPFLDATRREAPDR